VAVVERIVGYLDAVGALFNKHTRRSVLDTPNRTDVNRIAFRKPSFTWCASCVRGTAPRAYLGDPIKLIDSIERFGTEKSHARAALIRLEC